MSFVEDFKKMLEGEQETVKQVNAEACRVTLEDLKKQKRINNIQLTKLYSRLVRLMAEESVNIDAILTTLEDRREGVGCNTTVGRLSCYTREEWRDEMPKKITQKGTVEHF